MNGEATRRLLEAMPKAELHLHLTGSMRPQTALELAAKRGISAPRTEAEMAAALSAPPDRRSQAGLLRAFALPIALLQDEAALARSARELVEDKAAENVRYVEIRLAPLQHTAGGLTVDQVIAAVLAGCDAGTARWGTTVRLLAIAMRSHEPEANLRMAEIAGHYRERGLVGFDLAGPEAAFPDPALHRRAFDAARAAGLHITLHAGEWGGAAQVRSALASDPERIAHGPLAIHDLGLCGELRERRVTLDLCPSSNVDAGIVPTLAAHPIGRLFRLGVPVTLSSDARTVSGVTLTEEFVRVHEAGGMSMGELWAIDRHALDVAFADDLVLDPLRAEFDRWASASALWGGDGAGTVRRSQARS